MILGCFHIFVRSHNEKKKKKNANRNRFTLLAEFHIIFRSPGTTPINLCNSDQHWEGTLICVLLPALLTSRVSFSSTRPISGRYSYYCAHGIVFANGRPFSCDYLLSPQNVNFSLKSTTWIVSYGLISSQFPGMTSATLHNPSSSTILGNETGIH